MSKSQNYQDAYLNQLRKEKVPVTVFLTNGVRLKGIIKGFDNFVIIIKEANTMMVYKHAVSTIVPDREIEFTPQEEVEK